MIAKREGKKRLAMLVGISLLLASTGLPSRTIRGKAETISDVSNLSMGGVRTTNINLNIAQDDGSYVIAGISDPGKPAKSGNWGEEKDSGGNVIKSGSYIYYGAYQQSSVGDGSYRTEPVKWRVLDADTMDFNAKGDTTSHTMFLMSDKVLDAVNYHESQGGKLLYPACNLRKWLNSEAFEGAYLSGGFLNNAFCTKEQRAIVSSRKSANDEVEYATFVKDNSGLSQNGLTDKIFALSAEEINSEAYGFFPMNGNGGPAARLLTATDYAVAKSVDPTTNQYKNWWLRSRVTNSYNTGIVDCTGWLWAAPVDGVYSDGKAYILGVTPAFNMDVSQVSFTSARGTDKSESFELTSSSESREWNLTMKGGSGFVAERNANESGAVKPGDKVTVDITDIGTPDVGVSYTQISAMLVNSDNTVAAYGKIADKDASKVEVTIPAGISFGDYTLKIFAEEILSDSGQSATDFASNMAELPITVADTYTVSMINPEESHITHAAATGNGTEKQGVVKDGGSYTPVVYIADRGYCFPENYSIAENNGITVTRDSFSQITVSGTPTGDVEITLEAATEKDSQKAPEGLSESEGRITGTTTAMEYRLKPIGEASEDLEWSDCTDGFTEVVMPGTYEIRYKETETKKAGEVVEITVLERYTVTIINPENSHIIRSETAENGTERQKVKGGEAIISIEYTAENGYYFPDGYRVSGQNGIIVTRNSMNQITVSGIPTGECSLTLTAATKQSGSSTPGVRPVPVPTPAITPSPIPSPTVKPTSEPDFTPSPVPTSAVTPSPVPTSVVTPSPVPTTPTVKPIPTLTPTGKPDLTPTPTVKPTVAPPEVTKKPGEVVTSKEIKANSRKINMGTNATYDGKKLTMAWGKVAGSDGYDIFVITCGKKLTSKALVKTVKGGKTFATVTKVTGKKNYKLKIKAYKLVNGKKVYWAESYTYHIAGMKNKKYTNAKKIKVSSKQVSLKKGKTSQIKAEIVKQSKEKKLLSKAHGASLRYLSADTKIATVTANGKITAKKKGTCYVYVIALDGVSARIKITVK